SYDIARECPVFPSEPEHLLAARIGLLFFAEFGCTADLAVRFNFYQLVDNANGWSIGRSGESGADSEGINARVITEQPFDAAFVAVPRDENPHIIPATSLQSLSGPSPVRQHSHA